MSPFIQGLSEQQLEFRLKKEEGQPVYNIGDQNWLLRPLIWFSSNEEIKSLADNYIPA